MPDALKVGFVPFTTPGKGVLILFCSEGLEFGAAARKALSGADDLVKRAAAADRFTGKSGSALDLVAPSGLKAARLLLLGVGKEPLKQQDVLKLGGIAIGKVPHAAPDATIIADLAGGPMRPNEAAELALGANLRAYSFDRYKTKRKEGEDQAARPKLTIAVADTAAARKAWAQREPVAAGVTMARDLVNEPANILYPEEFARRAAALKKKGLAVEVLGERDMKKLGMNALLGVGQGSARDSYLVVMRWNGGKRSEPPVSFVGKGVCFDTGGISIKPAANMEDMKGDMAGAACVVGLMHALATRKAKVNAVGVIGLVENMPSADAQRPGDIVRSMSGELLRSSTPMPKAGSCSPMRSGTLQNALSRK